MKLGRLLAVFCLLAVIGCAPKPEPSQLSGKVTFKGQPVPAGYIALTPDVATGNNGEIRVLQIKDGAFDSAKESEPGLNPGQYIIRIAGFDGIKIPLWGQGKQIFNPIDDSFAVPEGVSTKDFVIPDSAGDNLRIEPTADT